LGEEGGGRVGGKGGSEGRGRNDQALYAHMNNKTIKIKKEIFKKDCC
jgi:hypothetical protein